MAQDANSVDSLTQQELRTGAGAQAGEGGRVPSRSIIRLVTGPIRLPSRDLPVLVLPQNPSYAARNGH